MTKLGRRKKKYRPNMLAMAVMALITALLVFALISRTTALEDRLDSYNTKIASLNMAIAQANQETEKLEEQRIYMQTSQFIIETAKNILGLVDPDEILIVPQD